MCDNQLENLGVRIITKKINEIPAGKHYLSYSYTVYFGGYFKVNAKINANYNGKEMIYKKDVADGWVKTSVVVHPLLYIINLFVIVLFLTVILSPLVILIYPITFIGVNCFTPTNSSFAKEVEKVLKKISEEADDEIDRRIKNSKAQENATPQIVYVIKEVKEPVIKEPIDDKKSVIEEVGYGTDNIV